MPRYVLLALNGPTPGEGDEEAYNKWYAEVHLPDLRAIKGVKWAKRYKTVQSNTPWPYVAMYEIETDDLQQVFKDMETNNRPFDPAFDRTKSAHILAVEIDGGGV